MDLTDYLLLVAIAVLLFGGLYPSMRRDENARADRAAAESREDHP